MSGYGKPQDAIVDEYHARRPPQAYSSFTGYYAPRASQDPLYLQNALPGASGPRLQQASPAYDPQSDHMNYGASAIYQPRATFEATASTYHEFELLKALRASAYSPGRGTKGTQVYVYLESSSDLLSPTTPVANLMFAKCSVPAVWNRLQAGDPDACYKYSLLASAPALSETGSSTLSVPLRLQLQDRSGLDVSSTDVGEWVYEDGEQLEHRSFSQNASRKRKVTDEPSGTPRPTKRTIPSENRNMLSQEHGSNAYPSANLAYPQSLDFSTMQRKYTAYGRSQLQQSLRNGANIMGPQGLIGDGPTAQSLMGSPTGQTSSWVSSYGAGYQSGRNSQPNPAPSLQVSSIPSPPPANPGLIRTSKIPHPSPRTTPAGSSSDGNLNPYMRYARQAVLELHGSLDAMQANWSPEERAARRRIVRFRREQNGATINTYFRPVRADEQPVSHEGNERRISCIYWEERDEYYVTSVDTILLLETLVDVQAKFETEEKNRIRRNLETYRPETLSKGDDDSESFFRLVMDFSNPQARNITKDLKVFQWTMLEQALKKIISKYSAWPFPEPLEAQPRPSFNRAQSEARAGRRSAQSSRSPSGSTPSTAYAQTPQSSTLSPPTASHGLPSYSPLSQASAPGLAYSHAVSAPSPQYFPSDAFNSPFAPQVSIPSLPSAYPLSSIGHRRSSEALTEDNLASTNHYFPRRPSTSTFFASQYAPPELSEATATLGLPGRASQDLTAFLNTDVVSSGGMGDAQ